MEKIELAVARTCREPMPSTRHCRRSKPLLWSQFPDTVGFSLFISIIAQKTQARKSGKGRALAGCVPQASVPLGRYRNVTSSGARRGPHSRAHMSAANKNVSWPRGS